MKTSPLLLGIVLLLPMVARTEDRASCAEFNALVKRIYNFEAARLSKAQLEDKEEEMDAFWDRVKANKARYLPCLRAKVADPKSRSFFRYDGANLLVEASPSLESKRLQVEVYTTSPLDYIPEGEWVSLLTVRGTEGFDVSKAAKRAMDDDHLFDEEPLSNFQAAQFLWGSQSEERSTPQLFLLANNLDYAKREIALALLFDQATPQALSLVRVLNQEELSDEARSAISRFLRSQQSIAPRSRPKVTRAQFLRAYNDFLRGNSRRFSYLASAVEDNERDAAAVLLPSDLPLLRRVRRRFLRTGPSEFSLAYYEELTGIIFAVMSKQARIV